MISRRRFLSQLVATGALAPFAHLLPKAGPLLTMESTAKGRLSLELVERTYANIIRGHDQPDLIWTDMETYRRLVRLVKNVNDHPERWHWETVTDELLT